MALLLECVERRGDLARRQQFDGRFQSRVLLAHDLISLAVRIPASCSCSKGRPAHWLHAMADFPAGKGLYCASTSYRR